MTNRFFFSLVFIFTSNLLCAQLHPKRELRAAWIASVVNVDWPSQKGLNSYQQQQEYVKLLDILKEAGMNAVIVQVRPTADAFYPSSYEPWSEYLSGIQGRSPSPYYNPLAFMIEQARKRGLEFHAWFNPYRVSMSDKYQFDANHPAYKHPEWFLKYGGKWYYDPGNKEAQEFVLQSIMETVKHYDLDAVHFDDYFYPYRIANEEFPDSCAYYTHGVVNNESRDDWRRENVNYFVKELSTRIKVEKPHVKFGISPFGVWRNKNKDVDGSDTQAGQTNYDDLYADVLKWLKEGWIDYVAPQLYWNIGFKVADYTVLLDWWSRHTYGKHLYIGQGAYRIGGKGWENPDELNNQIRLNRSNTDVNGSMFFSAKVFLQNKNGIRDRLKEMYPHQALIPVMGWIDSIPPAKPVLENISGSQGHGLLLTWRDSVLTDATYYIVYRFNKSDTLNLNDPSKIQAIVFRNFYEIQSWSDNKTQKRKQYTYVVTAVDRLHNESTNNTSVSIKTRGKRGSIKRR
ncbi:glycoside hydrolase family 10 protein [Chryseosolibacter indicus]|uniref:Family 10 glycosylhydrolase n=1 Tax=Chryseosolibacter indicus TaxID=2782351 RepID=A0ABS5VWA8_9BACT|nr:family 10 glycosylhydrolase [Chryseosolibacter indicus]MBT1705717.1 family 10 glycosylhydrolase [Chryseosolibacter indicus]